MPAPFTALITGASSGIGREIAVCLAKDGYALILHGRDEAELALTAAQAAEAAGSTGVPAIAILADLSTETGAQGLIDEIRARGRTVDLLVNNAGFGVHGNFVETSFEQERALTGVHVMAPWLLTKTFLPEMVRRGRGGVLNVGSVYAFGTAPWQALYGAAKSWIVSFTLAVREEVRGTGVHVTVAIPGTTLSKFRTRFGLKDKKSWFTLTSAEVAEAACLALKQDRAISVPGVYYKLFVAATRLVPVEKLGHFIYLTAYRIRKIPVKRLSAGTAAKPGGH